MNTTDPRPTVLVTGATGVVGSALLERHLADVDIVALYRSAPGPRLDNVTWVRGDTRRDDLGLGAAYRDLCATTDRVVHMAAAVDYNAGTDLIWSINDGGTKNVTTFAGRANADFVHVSSSFIFRRDVAQRITGSDCSAGRDAYLDSKRAGEQHVVDAGVPYAILRPSLVIGDSATGEIIRRQGLHTLIGAYVKGLIPANPLKDDAVIDYVPQDLVAAAIARVAAGDLDGTEYMITGGPNALTIGEMRSISQRIRSAAGYVDADVRYVSLDTIQRLMWPAFISTMGTRYRVLFENMLAVTSMFTEDRFESDLGNGTLADVPMTKDTAERAMVRTIERYWARPRASRKVSA